MDPSDSDVRTILMTTPDEATGERIARVLVEERLAACGSVLPGLTSVFRWEGEVERAQEALVILKTLRDTLDTLLERAAALHPYEVPELLVLPVETGHRPYLDWVRSSCASVGSEDDTRAVGS